MRGTTTVSPEAVCAVIVTYHPSDDMIAHLSRVRAQVQGIVVVDNGSGEATLAALRSAGSSLGFCLIENGDNLGIAEALNQGVRWVMENGYRWVILFDQDSKITEDYMRRMFASLAEHPKSELIASMHPRYVNPGSSSSTKVLRAVDGGPVRSLTSGALMPTWIFDKIGWFASEYFIDEVDTEFCYRIRAAGFLIADSSQAELVHSIGHPKPFSILGFKCLPTNHSPMRRYYMTRNRIALYRKYVFVFPRWVVQSAYETSRETIKCFLTEEARGLKFRNYLLGTWDGLIGRMGRREGI